MTQQEIQERNKQIALMLGWYEENNTWKVLENFRGGFIAVNKGSDLKFNSDWNWLMEAVELIEKIYNNQPIYFGHNDCVIFSPKTIKSKGKDKKEAVFIAVSDFAKLYNNKEI
jgi:hypothetical protein